jgi:hypothetical protein
LKCDLGGTSKMVNREMSAKTWKELDGILWKIWERAIKNKDSETIKDADRCNALIRQLSGEIEMEDWNIKRD